MSLKSFNFRSTLLMGSVVCALLNTTPCFAQDELPDRYQDFNRHAFRLNKTLDKIIFKPLATVYKTLLPWPVKKGVSNFFSNLGELPTIANGLLQAKFSQATSDGGRLFINSTFGIGGLFDMASAWGIPKHTEDLGTTFAHWGFRSSSYLVLPIFGPSTVRDTIALPFNLELFTVYPYINSVALRNSLYALNTVNQRASFLDMEGVVKQASFDEYVFQRDAYLQRRHYLINGDDEQNDDQFGKANVTSTVPLP